MTETHPPPKSVLVISMLVIGTAFLLSATGLGIAFLIGYWNGPEIPAEATQVPGAPAWQNRVEPGDTVSIPEGNLPSSLMHSVIDADSSTLPLEVEQNGKLRPIGIRPATDVDRVDLPPNSSVTGNE